ncbi:hypothetical protein PACTADRAFT_82040 [Pachysolen tannophilus NRRL Y-2460]|uniref:Uncharacterized protein n=1 Tax=Pachysolen tannophilus NRRL Y-2460 TaxID=669874 RepID=A0A1E4TRX6_PACTA|nr:hypothetical protein PACTADRAFT_82040 [Pachysolen tannophilus NRRL Y-2460]
MNSQIKRKRELKPANKKKEIINNDIKLPSLSEIPLNIDKFPKQNSSSVVPTKLSAESQTSSHYDNNDSTILLVTPVKKKKSGITKSQHAAKVVNSSLPTVPTLRHNSTNEIINDNNTPQLMSSPSKYLSTPSSMGAAKSLLQLALLNQD